MNQCYYQVYQLPLHPDPLVFIDEQEGNTFWQQNVSCFPGQPVCFSELLIEYDLLVQNIF